MMLAVTKEGGRITVRLPRLFGFVARNEFKQAVSGNPLGTKYTLDFMEVERMDSSALGMMLLLREASGGEGSDIVIINARPDIRQLLTYANFHTLFKIM